MPPLNLLKTFEAAAWHSSFTVAGQELNMTQSAVSQQVRQLEDFLGQRLFDRLPRRLQLTPEGAIFANSIRESLTMIGRACLRLRDPKVPTSLKVDVFPSFGTRWFSARVSSFLDAYPDIKLTVLASKDEGNGSRAGIDLTVGWGRRNDGSGRYESLGAQPIFPVCSPAYLENHKRISEFADLITHRRLQTLERNHWPAWFEAASLSQAVDENGPYFSDATMMLEACVEGQGIGLATFFLVERDLLSGRLVCPVNLAIEIGEGFHFTVNGNDNERPASRVFREWLAETAKISLSNASRWITNVKTYS
ncbi:LysR substrate-binding domain-containing protein [Phyllobacterium sp. SB3]|uniref:LysR substrate-binding domain-containing protein n=1 Tax=Phyllobacterium sp. SB3 TaxID=3156073 RepID=UPI0032AE9B1D